MTGRANIGPVLDGRVTFRHTGTLK